MQPPVAAEMNINPRLDGPKVGLIIPSVNTTTEPEFYAMGPSTVSWLATRVFMDQTTPDALRTMNRDVVNAARLLATAKLGGLAYACTAGSFVDGDAATRQLVGDISQLASCPAVATACR